MEEENLIAECGIEVGNIIAETRQLIEMKVKCVEFNDGGNIIKISALSFRIGKK